MGARASKGNKQTGAAAPRLLGNRTPANGKGAAKIDVDIPVGVPTMAAFGIRSAGGIDVLEELLLPVPEVRPKDLLIRVEASAMNPVDFMVRNMDVAPGGFPKVLGWDGAGIVEACGPDVAGFKVGDRVYFAGSVMRNGSNADLVAVDERIVAQAPASISAAVASSVPLVTLTAWEGLEHLGLNPSDAGSGCQRKILVMPGAGGVGSYVIQLAKACGLQVIATASREESREACKALGADFVINHNEPLKPQLEKLGINGVPFIYDAVDFKGNAEQYADIILPFGKIVSVTMFAGEIVILDAFKFKAVSIMTEAMFTRSNFETDDMAHQGEILSRAAKMIDAGMLQTPIWETLPWSLDSLRKAHSLQESRKAIGKIVLARS